MSYALIAWGGQLPNQRPRTALAYCYRDGRGKLIAAIVRPDGTQKYKRAKQINDTDLLFDFGRHLPSPANVRAAKASLPIVPADDARFSIDAVGKAKNGLHRCLS